MAQRSYKKKPAHLRLEALERIKTLIDQADKVSSKDQELADRYAALAKRISMKFKIRLPPNLKRRICKGCHKLLTPGKNCRIRTARGHVVIYCMRCKRVTRIVYAKKK